MSFNDLLIFFPILFLIPVAMDSYKISHINHVRNIGIPPVKAFPQFFFKEETSETKTYFLVPPTKGKETRAKIVIIDTGIEKRPDILKFLCKDEHYDLTGNGIEDTIHHGTNIAFLIAKNINYKKNCLVIIKYYNENGYGNLTRELKGLELALFLNAKFINLSLNGRDSYNREKELIQNAIDKKIYVIVAAGNEGRELIGNNLVYPAGYAFKSEYFHVVGNGESDEKRNRYSNYGKIVTDWADGKDACGGGYCMSGTSQACGLTTGKIAAKITQ